MGEGPDKRDYIASNDKLDATGWTPDHSIGAGIAELIKGYRMIVNSVYGNIWICSDSKSKTFNPDQGG